MSAGGVNAAVRYFRTLFESEAVQGLSDGQLLGCFVERREQAALEALVLRHGSMVWGVCRRVLRDHHDAEDAFQATFLVLSRRAASIVPREKVGNWLYGVAYQTARKARSTRAKRRFREGDSAETPEPEVSANAPRNELTEVLDQELNRLPDKYRTPIVLCELEGKSHGEAAEQLGWPIGTVSGRLSRGRAMLAKRLARHGAMATGVSVAAVMTQDQATAGAPVALLSFATQAASQFAVGGVSEIPAGVIALTREVLRSMYFSKMKVRSAIAAAALLALTLGGAGIWQARSLADPKAPAAEHFRVTVNELLHDDSTVVAQVDIESPAGSTIELAPDSGKENAFNVSLSAAPADPDQPNGLCRTRFTIVADQVECKEGPTNAYKLMLAYKFARISGSTSDSGLMPAGKKLSNIVTFSIKSGEYKFAQRTKLFTYKGKAYSIVVNRPK